MEVTTGLWGLQRTTSPRASPDYITAFILTNGISWWGIQRWLSSLPPCWVAQTLRLSPPCATGSSGAESSNRERSGGVHCYGAVSSQLIHEQQVGMSQRTDTPCGAPLHHCSMATLNEFFTA
ncbi:unnamed protein product [Pleuronectes platessa]|uniref:Uncharacterized protein n=1 Tax=Pleuronectes platessa TaxID=8262 RepID=A0A9N7UKX7_PLEPL|nr:unnamed protein product [Pleuronectes platessa]